MKHSSSLLSSWKHITGSRMALTAVLLLMCSWLGAQTVDVDSLINTAGANRAAVKAFFDGTGNERMAATLVEMLSLDDRSRVTVDVLMDHYYYSVSTDPSIWNPRISDEPLTAWRAFLSSHITSRTPDEWRQWVNDNIRIDESSPLLTPVEVWQARVTSSHGRDILLEAGRRTMGWQ